MPPIRFGFYQQAARCAYPFRLPDYYREQVSRGVTTAVVGQYGVETFANVRNKEGNILPEEGLAIEIELMLEAGLIEAGQPVQCFSNSEQARTAWSYATRLWPELVLCNIDDPGPSSREHVRTMAEDAHRNNWRTGTNISGHNLKTVGDLLDVLIVQAHTWSQFTRRIATAGGKSLWAIWAAGGNERFNHMRYLAGMWAWRNAPEQLLIWTYQHSSKTRVRLDGGLCVAEGDTHTFAIPRPDGTIRSTRGYDGLEQGIKDCRVFEAASKSEDPEVIAYLETVRNAVPLAMMKPGRTLPRLQADEVREQLDMMGVIPDGS